MNQTRPFLITPLKVSNIIGTNVIDSYGAKLGDVKEIVIDPQAGKVAYAVISFGGFMGMGNKLFAVPFSALQYVPRSNEYTVDASREQLKEAPGFDADNWPTMADEQWNRDLYQHYGRAPFWE